MRLFKLIYVLYKMHLFSPLSILRLIKGIYKYGINITVLLYFTAGTYKDRGVLVDDNRTYTFKELFDEVERISINLKVNYQVTKGEKVGFVCRNNGHLVKTLFAFSRCGLNLYLLNADMGKEQLSQLISKHQFHYLVYDNEFRDIIEELSYSGMKILSNDKNLLLMNTTTIKIKRASKNNIILLSGGTTGNFKELEHKPSVFNYLNPFIALITTLKLTKYSSVYIAPPLYHADGLANVFLSIILGKKAVITKKFKADKACQLIKEHNVDVINVVPVMLDKMLVYNSKDLKHLSCIISGAAKLNPKLIEKVFNQIGDIIYNLYGTTETGMLMIATPEDLKYSPHTIGKKIPGVHLKILDKNQKEVLNNQVGQFCVRTKWSIRNTKDYYINTGDLGFKDENGYYFLQGRLDDMIVSGGENVYPIELEQILIKHPEIEDVAVIGVADDQFGQRLTAFILLKQNSNLSKENLLKWTKDNVARYQVPKEIKFIDKMPYTSIGKHDKKQLQNLK